MFDFLKKKIGGFIDGLTKKKGETEEIERPKEEEKKAEIKKEPKPEVKKEKKSEQKKEAISEKPKTKKQKIETKKATPEIVIVEKKESELRQELIAEKQASIKKEPELIKPPEPQLKTEIIETNVEPRPAEEEKPKERVKLGIVSTVKSIITREVEISESDVKQMLDDFELELLEADVDIGVAESIKTELTAKIVGAKIPKDKLQAFVSDSIKQILVDVLTNEKDFDIIDRVQSAEKPIKIMLIGINGAGKTTTIAKVAKLLMDNKHKVVFAAADTFRAAAIEQMAVHADRLGVKIIKRDYGSDPTSVAYDAVNYAKAHAIDAVLIDTAGRQDTNISLINEVKKMSRVIQPDLKIYIGESIAGNAIIEQIATFNKEIGLDAVILTKLDCDPKGGTMLSINKATGIPIIYVGVGQKYEDLERFVPEKIVQNIIG